MEELLCPNCGTELTENACLCPVCGENVEEYIREIKIERKKQLESVKKGSQTGQGSGVVNAVGYDPEKIKVLKRFFAAFCFTLAASVIGIMAVLFGGLI